MKHKIICGASEVILKGFEENSFDSCVCDPPYFLINNTGSGFMGKTWDSVSKEGIYTFHYEWATELYRVMKPGAHILVFGGTRTYHRMACAVEDAGFECRDMIEWFYGSGFPKSLDISKQIDKSAGFQRGKAGVVLTNNNSMSEPNYERTDKGEPITEEAIQWNGYGTGLKPAHEPILLARKPISERNIAMNVLKWGTGGINVSACRIGNNGGTKHLETDKEYNNKIYGKGLYKEFGKDVAGLGRFPSNLILDEEAGRMLDEQSGEVTSGAVKPHKNQNTNHVIFANSKYSTHSFEGSKGGASRFFYCAKASQNERYFYCTLCKKAYPMKEKDKHIHNALENEKYKHLEFHPTQKPLKLIEYLVRLITPPKGTILDPFMGTGTTLLAAEKENFNSTGIDSKSEYCAIAEKRLREQMVQQKIIGERTTIEKIGF